MKPSAAIAIALLGFGCSSAVPLSSNVSETVSTRGSLGTLRTRNRELLLFTSPSGLKVSVRAASGALLADRVDLETLQTIDPHLYDLCRSGVASRAPYLDATFRAPTERAEDEGKPLGRSPNAPTDR